MINFGSEEAEAIYITTLGNECKGWLQKSDKSFNNIEVNNLITRIKEYLDETYVDEYLNNSSLKNRFDYNSVLLKLQNDLANRLIQKFSEKVRKEILKSI